MALVVILAVLVDIVMSAATVLAVNGVAVLAAFALGRLLQQRAMPPAARQSAPEERRAEWIRIGVPLFLITGIQLLIVRLDIILLGAMAGHEAAGYYAPASRVADLLVFALASANVIVGPLIAGLHARNDVAGLQKILATLAKGVLLFTIPLVLFITFFGSEILGFFGDEYRAAYVPLLILTCGQVVNAVSGPVDFVMAMTGPQVRMLQILVFSAVLNVALNLILIPPFGLAGAASATASTTVFWNLAMRRAVMRRLGVDASVLVLLRRRKAVASTPTGVARNRLRQVDSAGRFDQMLVAAIVTTVGIIALVLTRWLVQPNAFIRLLDHPNERSLHATPVPRTGGLAVCAALLTAWVAHRVLPGTETVPVPLFVGASLVAAISIFDDRYGLSQTVRLAVQLAAALMLIYGGLVPQGEALPGMPLTASSTAIATGTVFLVLWLTNLYNFMDGMDGFAAGMAVIGFGALALLGWGQEDALFAGSALTVSAAAAGFLWFNFPPARIFMGDSGSTTLGFLVAAFAIWADRRDVAPVWLTLVIFSPFVVDATVTLLKRAARGEAVWRAHRSHYYQRLVQAGWGHRRTVLAEYAAMLVCAAAALATVDADRWVQWVMLCILAIAYTVVALSIHKLEKKHDANIHS